MEEKKKLVPDGLHHRFCVKMYADAHKEGGSGNWRCECTILEAYDKWRKKTK